MGDIKFENNDVIVEGSALEVNAPDIKLDFEPRRSSSAGQRRALVHDFQDGLTVNWSEDYPGGVTIRGVTKVPNELQVNKCSGTHLRMSHHDIHLDNASRRSNPSGNRRAMVHDFQDGLTLNWAEDYPGGVTIRGLTKIPQELQVSKLRGNHLRMSHHDIHLDSASRRTNLSGNRRAMVHDFQDGLTLNWAEDYPGGVTLRGEVKCPQKLSVNSVDVGQKLIELQSKIDALESRVAELESASP